MKNISELISRFKDFVPPEKILKRIIAEVIKEESFVDLKISQIDINRGIIRMQCTPAAKTKILMKKGKILDKLKDRLDKKSPRDIT